MQVRRYSDATYRYHVDVDADEARLIVAALNRHAEIQPPPTARAKGRPSGAEVCLGMANALAMVVRGDLERATAPADREYELPLGRG